jgi:hypothetical protein
VQTPTNAPTPSPEGETSSDAGSRTTSRKRLCRGLIEAPSSFNDDSAVTHMLEREDPYPTPTPSNTIPCSSSPSIVGPSASSTEYAEAEDEYWVIQFLDSDYFRQFVQPLMCSVEGEWLAVFCLWWVITKIIVKVECGRRLAEIEERFVVKKETS